MSNPIDVTTWTIGDCVEQLEFCGYECEAGTLKNNVAYKRILAIHDEQAARIASLEAALAQYADRGNWIEGEGGYEGTALCLIGPDVADAALKGGSDE